MQNDVRGEAVSTTPAAYMQVVGIVQSLAVGMLLQNAKFFQLLAPDHIDFASHELDLILPGDRGLPTHRSDMASEHSEPDRFQAGARYARLLRAVLDRRRILPDFKIPH